jgi:arylsulfatase A-like enzyme
LTPASSVRRRQACRFRGIEQPLARAALVIALAASAGACGGSRPREATAPPPAPAGIVLVSLDTLRADHVGCYGYALPTTPAIDALGREGLVFEEAIAHAPSTLASHSSILASLVPQHHGASFARLRGLPPEALTLAEVLKSQGYRTASFNEGGQLSAEFGVSQGFDEYRSYRKTRFAQLLADAGAWLERAPAQGAPRAPFFLFLHTYGPHAGYFPEPRLLSLFETGYAGPLPDRIGQKLLNRVNRHELPLSAADVRHIVAAYDAEIRGADELLGGFLTKLRTLGLYDGSVIAVTSDHGEELGERGRYGAHAHTLYDELLRVPLVIKLAGGRDAGRRVAGPVRGIDVAPTLLAAAGIPVPGEFEGRELLSPLEHPEDRPPALSWLDGLPPLERTSIRTDAWKLDGPRLYDLAGDPRETRDAAAQRAEVVASLSRLRDSLLASRPALRSQEVRPSQELSEQLRSLGYIE